MKTITINVNEDLLEKFDIALSLTKETRVAAIEQGMKDYISRSFESASREFRKDGSPGILKGKKDNDTGKANRKIPIWAIRPEQCNHRIIRAFFRAQDLGGEVRLQELKELCSDELASPELFVRDFKGNYAQMKLDGPKSHGKVFVDDGVLVEIWTEVADTLRQYKNYFC